MMVLVSVAVRSSTGGTVATGAPPVSSEPSEGAQATRDSIIIAARIIAIILLIFFSSFQFFVFWVFLKNKIGSLCLKRSDSKKQ
jgi:hypothetical protein